MRASTPQAERDFVLAVSAADEEKETPSAAIPNKRKDLTFIFSREGILTLIVQRQSEFYRTSCQSGASHQYDHTQSSHVDFPHPCPLPEGEGESSATPLRVWIFSFDSMNRVLIRFDRFGFAGTVPFIKPIRVIA